MTFNEARKVLGLGPDQDPRPHLGELRLQRERIAGMVREAPNDSLALRYQGELEEFDRALVACREYLDARGLDAPDAPAAVMVDTPHEPPASAAEEKTGASATGRVVLLAAWLLAIASIAAAGGWVYLERERESQRDLADRLALLESRGQFFIEARRWQDAADVFDEIEILEPGSMVASGGRAGIKTGMMEEERQFIGYWTGQAIAELEAGRLDEAESAARRVLEKHADASEAAALLDQVADARERLARRLMLDEVRSLLDARQWQQAVEAARGILEIDPANEDARELLVIANAAIEKQAADKQRAEGLFRMAALRDHGQFDQQALDMLREAAVLAPDNAAIAALLEKMSSYTRTLRVPDDFKTPADALATARDRDRILIAAGSWKGPLVVNAAVDIEGAGPGQTVIECPPADGSPIAIGPDARGARINGISFRHETFLVDGSERYAAAVIRGGGATFVDCHFTGASGHGLAVIDGGEVVATRCRFSGNGWNGAAAIGPGSRLEVRESEASDNFGHGIESWDGAAITLANNRCTGNTRNGIHADNFNAAAVIDANHLSDNREYALVLTSAGAGKISNNTARANLLGGFVIRRAAAGVDFHGNQARNNLGPGLILESGLAASRYADNQLSGKTPQQFLSNVDFPQADGESPEPEQGEGTAD
jgi:tetratricopeptide (TPR) repeat protein